MENGNLELANKRLKSENNCVTVNKYVLVPVATIGCGKTTVALTLEKLFGWGVDQNDNLTDGKRHLEKNALQYLRGDHEILKAGIASTHSLDPLENNVVVVDRNNHMIRERRDLINTMETLKSQYLPNGPVTSQDVIFELKFIALNFIPLKNDDSLWDITHERVTSRGDNHQSIKPSEGKVEGIMRGFIDRFQAIDQFHTPDSLFDLVIDLSIYEKDSSKENVKTIIKELNKKYTGIIEKLPTDDEIDQAFKEALLYKPTYTKRFDTPRTKAVQEADVGITNYLSDALVSFAGTLKQRYNDFLVNEVDLEGNVVHLVDEGFSNSKDRRREKREKELKEGILEIESKKREEEQREREAREKEEQMQKAREIELAKQPLKLSEIHEAALLDLFGPDDFANLIHTVENSVRMVTVRTFEDKQKRTQLHQLLREVFPGKLESITNSDNTILIGTATRRTRKPKSEMSKQPTDPYGLGPKKEFLHFALYKENKDTMEVANLIARFLRINFKQIRYAGTKDRRAVTVQNACVSKIPAERVNSLNKTLRGIRLGSFRYSDTGLSLGDLEGNEFTIAIRDVQSQSDRPIDEIVAAGVRTLREQGFINYYGMQRFGTFSISTHDVGRKILLSDWKGACDLILSNQEFVLPESRKAREIWESTRDAALTLKEMPRKCVAEVSILTQLTQLHDKAYSEGIMKIPRNLRIMYGHAYQSYVWNKATSKRIELFGLTAVVGDLVIASKNTKSDLPEVDELEGGEDVKDVTFIRARSLTQSDIDSGKYSIYDVVLPTPGFDILYPENPELRKVYVDIMAADGLDPFKMSRSVRDFSFAGAYRHVLHKPQHIKYAIRHYEEPSQNLMNNDLDLLKLRQGDAPFDDLQRILPDSQGGRVAVILTMTLGTSAYATMALRELMKIDTNRRSEHFDVKH